MIYSTNIDDLAPDVAANCRAFISLMAADGYIVQIVNTRRDQEKQTELCDTIGAPRIVTFHAYGLAFDICEKKYGYSRPDFFTHARKILTILGFSPVKGEESHSQWDDHGKVTGSMILAGKLPPPMEAFMIPENQFARDKHNVTAWHKAGYTGKRARAATFESKNSAHGFSTWFAFKDFAPDCDIVCLPDIEGGTYAEKLVQHNIDIAFCSLMTDDNIPENLKMPEVENCLLLQAVGNTDDAHYSYNLDLPYWHGISACASDLDYAGYSLQSLNNLCAVIGTVYVKYGSVASPEWGTSFSAPRTLAMLALVDDKAINVYGKPLAPSAKIQFVQDHAVNPYKASKEKVGNGIFVLPDPSIDLSKYIEGEEMVYKTITDVPVYWRKDIQELLDCGAINGGTDKAVDANDVNLTESEIKAIVVMKKYIDSKTR